MESVKEYSRTEDGDLSPAGWAAYWTDEFKAADEAQKDWLKEAEEANTRFLDEGERNEQINRRLNLFTSNIQTLRSMLYGKLPTVDVVRKFQDAKDDSARVAAEMLQRLLNCDIERDSDSYATAMSYALDDRLIAGMGNVRVRYEAKFEDVEVPPQVDPMTGTELAQGFVDRRKTYEDAATDYVYWGDQKWSPCRVFHEVRWWAFKAEIRRDEARERFPEDAEGLPVKGQSVGDARADKDKAKDPWDRICLWEIWSKEHKKVFWFVEGYDRVLDAKDDTLGLEGFWPFPMPMIANLTTTALMPKTDWALSRDLYDEIDIMTTRIGLLEDAIRVTGVYDQQNQGLSRLLTDGGGNKLYPVANFAMFAEKGGMNGAIGWFPLDQVVNAIAILTQKRDEKIQLLYQQTGLSDIMRGAAMAGATATEQAIKARFASVRVQALQDEFSRFAGDVQKLKAEIISKHFDPETIVRKSNVMATHDAELAQQGVQVIKDKFADYRVEVKPENVSMTDFAALRSEALETLQGIGAFIQSVAPLAQLVGPAGGSVALELLQSILTKLKGGDAFEPILDRAVDGLQKMAAQPKEPPPPDPRVMAAQMKQKADMAKTQMDVQAHAAKKKIDVQSDAQMQKNQALINVAEERAKQQQDALRDVAAIIPGRA